MLQYALFFQRDSLLKWLNFTLLLLIIWALFQGHFGDGGKKELKEKQLLLAAQQEEIKKLEERNEKLEAEVQSLKTGLEAIEERARAELGMVKEGETFIQVINPSNNDGQWCQNPPDYCRCRHWEPL